MLKTVPSLSKALRPGSRPFSAAGRGRGLLEPKSFWFQPRRSVSASRMKIRKTLLSSSGRQSR